MPTDVFSQLDREWPRFARSRQALAALSSWKCEHPDLCRFDDLDSLCHDLVKGGTSDRGRLMVTTATLAKTDPVARRLALQVMVPGLARVARSYCNRWDSDDTAATVLHFALERLATWNLERPVFFAAGIVLEANRDLYVSHRRDAERRSALGTFAPYEDALAVADNASVSASDTLADVLAHAVASNQLAVDDAELIYLSRIAGRSSSRLAAERGVHVGTVRKRRQRAERALVLASAEVA